MSATTSDSADSTAVSVPDNETVDTEHHLAAVELQHGVRNDSRSEFSVETVRTSEKGVGFIDCRVLETLTTFRCVKHNLGEHSDQLKNIQFCDGDAFTVVLHPTE